MRHRFSVLIFMLQSAGATGFGEAEHAAIRFAKPVSFGPWQSRATQVQLPRTRGLLWSCRAGRWTSHLHIFQAKRRKPVLSHRCFRTRFRVHFRAKRRKRNTCFRGEIVKMAQMQTIRRLSQARVLAISICLVFSGFASCLKFECAALDASCRGEALLPWLLLLSNQSCGIYEQGLVSVASDKTRANGASSQASISANGRYVVFTSNATNLVAGDTNGVSDVFLHDRATGETTRVSVGSGGVEATGGQSTSGFISDDGRYVAFLSQATNLVAGDTNGVRDAFVYDRTNNVTTRVSTATAGTEGDQNAFEVGISSDGRYIPFASSATNIVAGDTNGAADVFFHDRNTGITSRESLTAGGGEATGGAVSQQVKISRDATVVAFSSDQTNIVAGDTNADNDIFVRDLTAGTTTRVSVATGGTEGLGGFSLNPFVSGDGRVVAWFSSMTNLVAGDTNAVQDVFVHERATGVTSRVSVASDGSQTTTGNSSNPALNADGRYVVFHSDSTNLVAGDTNAATDVFLRDRLNSTTTRLSQSVNDGAQANGASNAAMISLDCSSVVFQSAATNLVTGDTNAVQDIFVVTLP